MTERDENYKPANYLPSAMPRAADDFDKQVTAIGNIAPGEEVAFFEPASPVHDPCPECGKAPERRELPFGDPPMVVYVACDHVLDKKKRELEVQDRHAIAQRREGHLGYFPPPKKFEHTLLADLDPERDGSKRGLEVARFLLADWAGLRKRGAGMFFYGSPGTGKTMLASAIANELRAQGYYTAFFKVKNLYDRLIDFSKTSKRLQILEAVELADFLVLDELISEKDTPGSLKEFMRLVDLRVENRRPTIVTSNFTMELAADQIDAILSREHGEELAAPMVQRFLSRFQPPAFKRVHFQGADLRLEAAEDWGPDAE